MSPSKYTVIFLIATFALNGCRARQNQTRSSDLLALTQSDLNKRYGIRVVPEVVNLPDDASLPQDILNRYDSRTVAESMIFRLHVKYDDISAGQIVANQQWMDDSILALRIKPETIEKYSTKDGFFTFLNQHQTTTSNGFLDIQTRIRVEENIADLKFANYNDQKSILPKYSWLSIDNGSDLGVKLLSTDQYGDYIAVFRREVKYRSTLTYTDSIEIFETRKSPSERRKYQSTFFTTDAYKLDGFYLEAQIWGDLDLSDVESFLIPETAVPPPYLVALGVPISRYKIEEKAFRHSLIIDKTPVNAGDPKKMQALMAIRSTNRRFNQSPQSKNH